MNLHPSTRGVAERAGCTGLKLQSPEGQRPVCSRKIVGRRVAALRTSNNTPRRKNSHTAHHRSGGFARNRDCCRPVRCRSAPSRASCDKATVESRPTAASLIFVAGSGVKTPATPVMQPRAGLPARSGFSQALIWRSAPSLSLMHVPLTMRKEPLRVRILRWRQERYRCSKTCGPPGL